MPSVDVAHKPLAPTAQKTVPFHAIDVHMPDDGMLYSVQVMPSVERTHLSESSATPTNVDPPAVNAVHCRAVGNVLDVHVMPSDVVAAEVLPLAIDALTVPLFAIAHQRRFAGKTREVQVAPSVEVTPVELPLLTPTHRVPSWTNAHSLDQKVALRDDAIEVERFSLVIVTNRSNSTVDVLVASANRKDNLLTSDEPTALTTELKVTLVNLMAFVT
jgi:hypothetical protein